MRLLFLNHIQNARQSLKNNRARSLLTMLGVTIGVASITAILALSGGTNNIIKQQINMMGGNIIVVRPGVAKKSGTSISQQTNYTTSTLTEADIVSLKNTDHVNSIAPIMVLSGTIKADSVAPDDSAVLATTPEFADISNLELRKGQFLDDSIDQNTVVIGVQLSINIFGSESSIGREMSVRGQKFVVIGVLKRTNNPINYNSIDYDNAVIMGFESGKKLNQNVTQIQQINIKIDSVENIKPAIHSVNETLLSNHVGENDFSVLTGDKISQPTNQFFYTIANFTTAVAAISLIVGGIGIMNIMLVAVAERTHEIGIRKALGASNGDISWQFIIESLSISLIGGIFGYIGGYIVAFSIGSMLSLDPTVNWQIALIALSISVMMGVIFGIYPAFRAARKDPIESLHQLN